MYKDIINEIETYNNVAILGFGLEGKSTYNFIRKYSNMHLTIIDKKDVSSDIEDSNVSFICGDEYLDELSKYDLIIKSPGVSLKDIDYSKLNITSQLELVLKHFKGRSYGITGTKGKSTTTSLIYEIIKNQNDNTYLVGNIGTPILDEIELYNDTTNLVIEMSSHMLEFMTVSPNVAIILNLYQDHLDHDGTVEHYHSNKLNIFRFQKEDDIAFYNADNEYLKEYMKDLDIKSKVYSISKESGDIVLKDDKYLFEDVTIYNTLEETNLIGDYNITNIVFALSAIFFTGYDLIKGVVSVKEFKPVDYRMMLIGTYNNVTYYSDTLSTIPVGTISGIEALKNVNTLIFGGMDRGIDYSMFVEYLRKCDVENLICMPETGYTIGKQIDNKNVYFTETLEEAVIKAKEVTKENKICLLSPAAASYEYFKNYMEKADKYKEYIELYNKKDED